MPNESMRDLAEAIRNEDVDGAKEAVERISSEVGGEGPEKFDELPGVGTGLAKKIQMRGIDTISKLARIPLKKLVDIPELREGKAKGVLDSARTRLKEDLTELPGVGENTSEELVKRGYTTLEDMKGASVENLTEVPGIGEKGAEDIIEYIRGKGGTELRDLPGVGGETAERMREQGFTAVGRLSEAPIEKIVEIPNIGREGAAEISNYAEENPTAELKDLPGVGEGTAEEIRKAGYTALNSVADSSVGELAEVPNIGENGAEKILEHAREKVGGRAEELPGIDGETGENLREHGLPYIKDVAKSSLGDLVEVPGLEDGRAKEVKEGAREILEEASEDVQGYIHALEGVLSSLKSDRSLTLPQKIAKDDYPLEKLKKRKEEMEGRASQDFRPPNERGYYEAWKDLLAAAIEKEKASE